MDVILLFLTAVPLVVKLSGESVEAVALAVASEVVKKRRGFLLQFSHLRLIK